MKRSHLIKNISALAFAISLIVHIVAIAPKYGFFSESSKTKNLANDKRVIKVQLTDKKQVVTTKTEKSNVNEPIDSKYLSEHTFKVDRQTTAQNSKNTFKKAGVGSKKGKAKSAKKSVSLSDLGLNSGDLTEQLSESVQEGLENGDASERGLASNNDYLEEVPLGDLTQLNTVEYKYYGFYYRIKQRLEQYWGNTLRKKAEMLYKSGRRLPASQTRITSLLVTLDTKGNIVKVKLKSTSGVNELDAAAVESFNKAGPFPNPPKGMMKNGRAQIEWGFVVNG